MSHVKIDRVDISVSRLGFGTASLHHQFGAKARREVMPTAYTILTQLSKLPKEILSSPTIWKYDDNRHVKRMFPAQCFAQTCFLSWFIDHIYNDPKAQQQAKKDQHMEFFSKFVQATS